LKIGSPFKNGVALFWIATNLKVVSASVIGYSFLCEYYFEAPFVTPTVLKEKNTCHEILRVLVKFLYDS